MSALQCGADKAFEDQLRAGTYSLLAELLAAPPDEVMLQRLQAIGDGESPDNRDHMAQAWSALKRAAEQAKPECLKAEFYTLFIGLGRGELVPYGSWYLTGFLMEKPLGDLRRNLEALGYQRQEHVRESEDHAAALCETMALLILDEAVSSDVQRKFFDTHVGSWIAAFFGDLEAAKSAPFYRAVGRLGSAFMKLEQGYLAMLV